MGHDTAVHIKLMCLHDREDVRLARGCITIRKHWEMRHDKLVVTDYRHLLNQAKLVFGVEESLKDFK